MTERPILFSGPMVRAILEGRKTQTRRIFRFTYHRGKYRFALYRDVIGHVAEIRNGDIEWVPVPCPYGQPGDRLWVRETFRHSAQGVSYRADIPEDVVKAFAWKPSIFMPHWASRITLEVTGVRVERLQQISEDDAVAEGMREVTTARALHGESIPAPAASQFSDLWDRINAKRAPWASNPWVWVIEFKREEK